MARRFVITLISLLTALTMIAGTYSAENIEMVYLNDSTRYVSNPDGILSPSSVAKIDNMLRTLEDSTSIQVAVIAVENVEGGDCYNFALNVGNKYGVGHREVDNGLVIVLATKDRCVQFATGYGLEGDLPDAICKRIQYQFMNNHFSKGEWDEGLTAGVEVVCDYLRGVERPELEDNSGFPFMPIIFVALFLFFPILNSIKSKRCPQCHKYKLKKIYSDLYEKDKYHEKYVDTYECAHCKKRVLRYRAISFSNGGAYVGRYGRGGGFGGGGFSGGSFGGGAFGGGGAGSRF